MCLALRDANINVQALSYGPRSAGAMRTPPWLPHDDKNTPPRRKRLCAAPPPMRMPLCNPTRCERKTRPKQLLYRPPTSFCASQRWFSLRYSVHNVASRPLEEALAASTSGLLQRRTS
ncbi:hypothetical protein B0H13DRAFT_2320657 [Mycena leptocephala]|nr:hypothetical protein B0H13DRAFT_2320657 [Mycena leptocephala]